MAHLSFFIADPAVKLFALQADEVIARQEDATFCGDGASRVDVVPSHHSHCNSSTLAFSNGIWDLEVSTNSGAGNVTARHSSVSVPATVNHFFFTVVTSNGKQWSPTALNKLLANCSFLENELRTTGSAENRRKIKSMSGQIMLTTKNTVTRLWLTVSQYLAAKRLALCCESCACVATDLGSHRILDAHHADASESGEDIVFVVPVRLPLGGGKVSVSEADCPQALWGHGLDHFLDHIVSVPGAKHLALAVCHQDFITPGRWKWMY